jgi:BlaI family transcriptional regulator, penicillinase repressor
MAGEFGDRELDVMGVLWETGSATVAEVRDRLPAELAYTTVLTILRNLEAKGFVRHEGEGKAHRYFPLVARQAAGRSAVSRLIEKLFAGDPALLVSHLVSDHPLSAAELKKLHATLEERLGEPTDKGEKPKPARSVAGRKRPGGKRS